MRRKLKIEIESQDDDDGDGDGQKTTKWKIDKTKEESQKVRRQ